MQGPKGAEILCVITQRHPKIKAERGAPALQCSKRQRIITVIEVGSMTGNFLELCLHNKLELK